MDVVEEYVRINTLLREAFDKIKTLKESLVPVEEILLTKLRNTNGHFIIYNDMDRPMRLRLTKITKRPNLDRKSLIVILSEYYKMRFKDTQSAEKINDFSQETCSHIWSSRKKKEKFKICTNTIKNKLGLPISCDESV